MKQVCRSGLVAMALALAGCAGPVETLAGATGSVPANLAVRVETAPDLNGAAIEQARSAVAGALAAQGFEIAPQARAVVTVGLAERDAAIAVNASGSAISPAKQPRLLQNCADRTQRLTLAFVSTPDAEPVRAFAEEHHCKASVADDVPSLARRAVELLLHPANAPVVVRFSRD